MKRVIFAAPWWHEELMQGVARQAGRRGWHINLEPALSGHLPRDWRGDGIVTTLGVEAAEFERFWRDAGCPAVSLSLNRPEVRIARVGIDNQAAGRLAAEHFIERGFKSTAFYDRLHQHSGEQRRDAFAQALKVSADVTVADLAIGQTDAAPADWLGRQQMLTARLKALPKPLGVFAADDAAAVEVVEACQSLGLRIPGDVGVLGMLDIPLFRHSTTVPISSIRVDFDRLTEKAFEVLQSMMEGALPPDEPWLMPPLGIAARASTEVNAARHPGVVRAVQFMLEQIERPIGVSDVVQASGMSQTRLFTAFREDLGRSPGAVLNQIRLAKARRALLETDDNLDVIATSCGFGDRVNLHRRFAQRFGISPGAFRRRERSAD